MTEKQLLIFPSSNDPTKTNDILFTEIAEMSYCFYTITICDMTTARHMRIMYK